MPFNNYIHNKTESKFKAIHNHEMFKGRLKY